MSRRSSKKEAEASSPITYPVEEGHLRELEVDISNVVDEKEEFDIAGEHSPYAEVRAVVPEVDDPALPVNTLRMWLLGIVFTMLGSGINQFFSLRYPGVHIVALVAELLAYPIGVFLAKVLPICFLNPDRTFNIKEHAVVTIMSNVSFGYNSADSTSIIQAANAFYNFNIPAGFSVLVVLCCQLLGYGVAGLAAPWIIRPASIIWPGVLSNCALLSTLHSRANAVANGWKISRLRFFMLVMTCAFIWYFFPGLIFTGLSTFTWICWIAPKNIVVNQLFGMVSGVALFPLTFDWSLVAYNTNPLLSPFWAALNVFAGFVIFFWIVVIAINYTGTWYTQYLPLMSADVYDNTASLYNVSKVMDGNVLDVGAYKNYSPPYLGAAFSFVYGLSFASITCVLVHVYLWHWDEIVDALRGTLQLDIHARLMKSYKKVPWYWFAGIIVVIMALSIAMVEHYHTHLPVYGVFLALVIPAVYMIPCGMIEGVTNVNANQLNVLSEFIGGYMFTGKPLANMVFKILSTDVVGQGLLFAQDMKLAHYLKVPPRTLFYAQGFATILGALTQTGVTLWMLGNVSDICDQEQSNGFSCPNGRTTFSSSVIWGAIGPGRLYSAGKIYSSLLHFFWIGALMPLIFWLAWKRCPESWGKLKTFLKFTNWPLIFVGTYNVPPATGINYSSWFLVNYIFNRLIFRRKFAWWIKYNYVLAAALDTGLAISGIIIFFCITYPGAQFPDWWGNTVWQNTYDGLMTPWKTLPEQGFFGPKSGWS
ncbi:MAG: hypothetical protein Q9227_000163 [Pyrenula ochraceoflavens]